MGQPGFVFAEINDRCSPTERGARYEDPLDRALREARLGAVTGGATRRDELSETLAVGLDVELLDLDDGLPFIVRALERARAPLGSMLRSPRDGSDRSVRFGIEAGLGIYIPTVDRDGAEPRNGVHVELLAADLGARLGQHGRVSGHWFGADTTAIYVYGPDPAELRDRLLTFISTARGVEGAEIVAITPLSNRP